jgi:putative pyruvate formate lyase activating enzyme
MVKVIYAREPPDPRFVLEPFEPLYLKLPGAELERRAADAVGELACCRICPRRCGVDRLKGRLGFCRTGRDARVTSAFAHPGEEDCLRGWNGSGTIFFGGCNLGCVFCQNCDISQTDAGAESSTAELGRAMLHLQAGGCHNLNFVTPTHVVPQILEAVAWAVPRGFKLPIVYNCGGYESLETLRRLDGVVDIYMPDFKFWEPGTAKRLANAEDYPDRARQALAEMHRQVGVLRMGPDGLARRGVLVRQLVMPGLVDESAAIYRWMAQTLSPDTYVNIMGQYRPAHRVGDPGPDGRPLFADLMRRPTRDELRAAYAAAEQAGLWRLDERWRA